MIEMIENVLFTQAMMSCRLLYTPQNTEAAVREKR